MYHNPLPGTSLDLEELTGPRDRGTDAWKLA